MANPARPDLEFTTDDNSRGGLFNRSNTGNVSGFSPVSVDTHVSAVAFDESSRDLTITLNNGTSYTVDIPGGGGTGDFPGFQTTSVTLSAANVWTITFADGTSHPLDLTTLATQIGVTRQEVTDIVNMAIGNLTIPTHFTDLIDTPADYSTASPGEVLRVDSSGGALEFGTAAGVSEADFEDSSSIAISNDIATSRIRADLRAQSGTQVTIGGMRVTPIIDANGVPQLSLNMVPPTPTGPTEREITPPPTNIFDPPADQTVEIDVRDVTSITPPTVRVTDDDGNSITPMITVTQPPSGGGDGMVEITLDGDDIDAPGDYTVTTDPISVDDSEGNPTTIDVPPTTVTRTIPAVQSRSPMTTATEIENGTQDGTEFDPMAGLTTITGSGTLYIAIARQHLSPGGADRIYVTAAGYFPALRRNNQNAITVTSGSASIDYFVYSANLNANLQLTNFRLNAR